MPTKRKNFWVLLTLLALTITGGRWLYRHAPQDLQCDMQRPEMTWHRPHHRHACTPQHDRHKKKRRRCGIATGVYTPGFNEFVRVDQEPQVLNRPLVEAEVPYPAFLLDAGIQGTATARILVDEHGNYQRHQLIHLSHPALRPLCDRQAALLEFTPAMRHGSTVRYWVNVPFSFPQ
ncbi:MAG: hypothetical protein D6722_15750 [Bacteroidetes bacterium]|nr:MAG: hypothetical protein D6722_15750 [Bacteroidota bacterium]